MTKKKGNPIRPVVRFAVCFRGAEQHELRPSFFDMIHGHLARLVGLIAFLVAGLVAALHPSSAASITLVRQPYLQRMSATSATVVWATREAGAAEARHRIGGGAWTTVNAQTRLFTIAETSMAFDYYQHEATLVGLTPSTTYTYDVLLAGVSATGGDDRFTTAPPAGTGSVSFIAFGDSGTGAAPQRRLAQLMIADSAANRWDLALHTGDVVYPKGTHGLLHERFFDIYAPWLRRRPVFLSFGNHEEYALKGKPYFDLFVLPENGANPAFPSHRERYYSFDDGPVHFIALDTQLTVGWQQQLDWLVRDLESTSQPWRIAFFHRPAFGSNEFVSAPDVQHPLRPIFERFGVHLVLEGHEHDYARGAPWRAGEPVAPGGDLYRHRRRRRRPGQSVAGSVAGELGFRLSLPSRQRQRMHGNRRVRAVARSHRQRRPAAGLVHALAALAAARRHAASSQLGVT